MTRVVVTGATTPMGRALLDALIDDPTVDRVLATYPTREGLPRHTSPRVTWCEVDVTRPRMLHDLLFGPACDIGIDSVVHLARHRCAADVGSRVRALNVEALREMLRLSARHPTIRRFVLGSAAGVYRVRADAPSILDEDDALDLSPDAPQWLRDRVEADLLACTWIGRERPRVIVLRLAECVVPDSGSQLHDQLRSRVCLRPLGFDPMLNLITMDDAVHAIQLALRFPGSGAFNIVGSDSLPLSEVLARTDRRTFAIPGPLLGPLYRLRSKVLGTDFRYDLNRWRYHFSGVMDGRRAREHLGYEPRSTIPWLQCHPNCSRSERGSGRVWRSSITSPTSCSACWSSVSNAVATPPP